MGRSMEAIPALYRKILTFTLFVLVALENAISTPQKICVLRVLSKRYSHAGALL